VLLFPFGCPDDSSRLQLCTASPSLLVDVDRPWSAMAADPVALSRAVETRAAAGAGDVSVHGRAPGDRPDQPEVVFSPLGAGRTPAGAARELRLQWHCAVRDGDGLVVAEVAAGQPGSH